MELTAVFNDNCLICILRHFQAEINLIQQLQDQQPPLLKKRKKDERWMSCDLNRGSHAHEWMPVWYLSCYC